MARYTIRTFKRNDSIGIHTDILDKEASTPVGVTTTHQSIPMNEYNRHYIEYLEWVEGGNTADTETIDYT